MKTKSLGIDRATRPVLTGDNMLKVKGFKRWQRIREAAIFNAGPARSRTCWRSASLTSSARDLHLALGLQAQRGNDVAQFDEPVVFVRLFGGVLSF